MLKLSATEGDILYATLMHGDVSIAELARMVGYREHVVRRAISKFFENGLIARRVFINCMALGYSSFHIYATLSSEGQKKRKEVIAHLVGSVRTSTVLEVGGEYDLFISVIVESTRELAQFSEDVTSKFGPVFARKDIAVTIRHSVFGEKLLTTKQHLFAECSIEAADRPKQVDELDRKILFLVGAPKFSTLANVARSIGVPLSTAEYRFNRLKSDGVICGDMHEIKGELVGLSNFIILLSMEGLSEARKDEFQRFSRLHPNITHFAYEVGHWDCMLGVSVFTPTELNSLVDLIRKKFGDFITNIKSFAMFNAHKVRDYPLDPERVLLGSGLIETKERQEPSTKRPRMSY
ncbi:MAG: winged helix-turn-helix transcriptional regulator [Pseudomonadota bacterium]